MIKLRLDLDALSVDSFATAAPLGSGRGTVWGQGTRDRQDDQQDDTRPYDMPTTMTFPNTDDQWPTLPYNPGTETYNQTQDYTCFSCDATCNPWECTSGCG